MIVVDTHTLIWWVTEPAQLSKVARFALDEEDTIALSAITCWEVAMLAQRGRIAIDDVEAWLYDVTALPRIAVIPLNVDIAVRAVSLPATFPADPADRIIAATALCFGVPLVTKDGRIRDSGVLSTVW
ncbi:MAG TPA: type II toxin-antitoxin system VapC family toxin [Thermoanaerobaculia bacterium]